MQFPQYVVYTPAIPRLHTEVWSHCYQGLWFDLYQTHITRPIKLLPCTVCVSLQTPTIVRAGQAWSAPRSGQRAPVEMGHHVWAGAHGLQGASVHELKSPRVVSLFWVLSSTSNWSSNWKTTSINSKSLSDTNTVWVWLVESTIAMEDIYVLCMLCTTVMLTNLFHLAIIVYLVYKFFN